MISPYPCFSEITYPNKEHDEVMYMYLNTPFFAFMMIVRSYHIFKLILNQSYYMTPRSQRVSMIYGTEFSYSFAIKSEFTQRPMLMVLFLLGYW